ncbi:MAG: hypothetical protein H0V18_18380 [Pyrinomonadaceae bacterium]|jgi:hypothetical protein|nr:hypothetical protein [Pyrinomonadaceae bacterium]
MVWLLFATPLERADTSEATGLPIYAPPLYSTIVCSTKPTLKITTPPSGDFWQRDAGHIRNSL